MPLAFALLLLCARNVKVRQPPFAETSTGRETEPATNGSVPSALAVVNEWIQMSTGELLQICAVTRYWNLKSLLQRAPGYLQAPTIVIVGGTWMELASAGAADARATVGTLHPAPLASVRREMERPGVRVSAMLLSPELSRSFRAVIRVRRPKPKSPWPSSASKPRAGPLTRGFAVSHNPPRR